MTVMENVHLKEMKLVIPKLTLADIEHEMTKYSTFEMTSEDPILAEVEQEATEVTEEAKQSTEDEDVISPSVSSTITTSSSDESDSVQERNFVPEDLICKICNANHSYSDSWHFKRHLQTQSHQRNLQKLTGIYVEREIIPVPANLTCQICVRKFTRPDSFKAHFQTILHQRNLRKTKETPIDSISKSDNVVQNIQTEDVFKIIHEVDQKLSARKDLTSLTCKICVRTFKMHHGLKAHYRTIYHQQNLCKAKKNSLDPISKPDKVMQTPKDVLNTTLEADQRLSSGKELTCKICAHTYSRVDCLKAHLLTSLHQQNLWKAKENLVDLISKPDKRIQTTEDMLSITPTESATARSRSQSQFNRHFLCGTCGTIFKELNLLKKHLVIHETEAPFSCEICDLEFRRSMDLHNHLSGNSHKRQVLKMCHDTKTGLDCIPCHKEFQTRKEYEYHLERPEHKKKCALYKRKKNVLQVGGNNNKSESYELSESDGSETETDNYDSEEEQMNMINAINAMHIDNSS